MERCPKILVVAGPTASGKSDLALILAQEFNGELICSDSMQVYRHMDIGTAKPTLKEQKLVQHHQLDIIDPDEHYSAGQYERDTSRIIKQIQERGYLPIVVGGTGLYYRALMYGISNIPEIPESVRREVLSWQKEHGTSYCWKQLQKHDRQGAESLHPNDTARILRNLEVVLATGTTLSTFQHQQPFGEASYPFLAVALKWERQVLYERINQRTRKMMEFGWVAEVESLLSRYAPDLKPLQTIGYREIVQYLQKKLEWEPLLQEIQKRTRQYAKRQMTWFCRETEIEWFQPDNDAAMDVVLFYVFFEVMLVPMYLLIGIWGGSNRLYATIKFFIYTMLGSLLMLMSLLYTANIYLDLNGELVKNIKQRHKIPP